MNKFISIFIGIFVFVGLFSVPAQAADNGFVTFQIGRAIYAQADTNCTQMVGSVNLDAVAQELQSLGYSGSANVVPDRTQETGRLCMSQRWLQTNWQDLARLRDTYGWSFVSAGQGYRNMLELTREQQIAESCGSLDAFRSRGHLHAWASFAYPNNKLSATIQNEVVRNCFAFGRKYDQSPTLVTDGEPYWHKVISINGGRCADTTLPCSTITVRNNRNYTPPGGLIQKVRSVSSGKYLTLQWYRFLQGKGVRQTVSWDCTSANPREHWTTEPETYCWEDAKRVFRAVPAGVQVVAPYQVANSWGVAPRG